MTSNHAKNPLCQIENRLPPGLENPQDDLRLKNPTLSDIAAAAGVSRSAAARVLLGTGGDQVRVSEATRARIEAAARRLRYAPNRVAQQLRGVSSKTLGVIIDSSNLPVMSQRLFALEQAAHAAGYRLLVGQTHGQEETLQAYAADFSGRGVEAVLCLFDLAPGRDQRARAAFGPYRKVVFHGRPAWTGGYAVRVDTEAAIASCVDHLIASGRRTIALSLWNSDADELMQVRREAFLRRLAHHKRRGIVCDAASLGSTPSPESLALGVDHMVRQGRADAILASNDIWATRYILHLAQHGYRLPQDVAIIGYDNLEIAEVVTPALTTIDQNHAAYAGAALQMLIALAAGRRIPAAQKVVTIPPRLIVRQSSGHGPA